ncbi:mechanosensitive ion channel family protein [Rhodothermus marinus]|uniref:mechanosensitive ion channel family protein n=1 Tax=Rhodothermus marinus TaxID=29549 RepID=UPI0012BA530E|nr:mechanosensitive ion channel family protein [Rhodothermus marinus]BBM69148.1 mechanosensitive ion channel protein MscS [Rhodothermus marinus]BBM72141.1 mechanosensitive ion channel protein MscS [Rhodothermus marinus]
MILQADTLQTLADTQAAAPDTADVITELSQQVSATGQLLVSGQWDQVLPRIQEGLAGLAVSAIPRLTGALFVFLFFYAIYRVVGAVLRRALRHSRRIDATLEHLLMRSYRLIGLSFITVMVLAQLGINVTALLAGLSIAGIAIGFAARDTLENFISGLTILIDRPFRVGDPVEISGTYGIVEEITLRSTRVRTLNNEVMVMPNVQMINQKLINYGLKDALRIEIPFGIAYKEYPEEARRVVLRLTEGDERLHPDYPPSVVVTKLNDSSVDMVLRLYIRNPHDAVPMKFEYTEKIREALREADIEIPFPHRQLFIDEAKAFERATWMRPASNGDGEQSSAFG